jgi:hypothetical protein
MWALLLLPATSLDANENINPSTTSLTAHGNINPSTTIAENDQVIKSPSE